jgi:hypothetical protein
VRVLPLLGMFVLVASADASAAHGRMAVTPRTTKALCYDSTAGTGVDLAYYKRVASSTDAQDSLVRRGLLPSVPASEVVYVRDTSLCRRISESFRRLRFGADTGVLVPVELFRYGSSRYLSSWPIRAGEFNAIAVFDTSFTLLGVILQS